MTNGLGDLRRILSPLAGVAVCVGMAVGSGILRTPGEVASALPSAPWILFVWLLGALVATFDAMILAEMASSVPRVGGLVAYLHLSFGRLPAFLCGWSMLLVTWPASLAAVAVVFGELAVRGASSLELGGNTIEGRFVGSAMVTALALLNLRGLKFGARTEVALFLAKVVLLSLVCLAAVLAAPSTENAIAPSTAPLSMPASPFLLFAAIGAAMKNVLFSYDGYADAVYMAGETENPGKALPRALFTSLVTITLLYVFANAAFLYVLGTDGLAQSRFAALDVAKKAFGDSGESILTVVAMVILLGAANAYFLTGPRIARVLAEEGLAPRALGRFGESGAPPLATLLVLVTALVFLWSGSFDYLISITIPIISATVALVAIGLLVQRRRAPLRERPFRVPFAPLVVTLQVVLGVFLVSGYIADNPEAVAIDLIALLVFVLVFFVTERRRAAT
ncbi:MAG: amino acid permease [Planctomycetota bacterium]